MKPTWRRIITCSVCGREGEKQAKDVCTKCYQKKWIAEHREQKLQRWHEWIANNLERYRATRRAITKRKYHALTAEQKLAKSRARKPRDQREHHRLYYQQHREEWRIRTREYKKKHPEYAVTYFHRRRDRLANNGGSGVKVKQWLEIVLAYRHRCVYCCQKFERLTMDHIVPVAKGGKHDVNNVVPACRSCNCTKQDRSWPVILTPVMAACMDEVEEESVKGEFGEGRCPSHGQTS